ncbi:UDP-3-O-(3-hydroxymyristoyl)glucosamine N-acyltransferase [Dichotomicrobium thermohalophilum]|nr:UDP-3-O-(3-hydroxymyristoyl)glucosamine N-acyltransferase [Dichotomicrobium thermohalophilum]
MTHRGFFRRAGPFSVAQIAERVGAELASGAEGDRQITDVRPISEAGAGDISFLDNRRYASELRSTSAGACLLRPAFADKLPENTVGLLTDRPYHALARTLFLFYPDAGRPLVYQGQDGPVHPTARIEEGASIEPGAVIGAQAEVGAGTVIAAGAAIGYGVKIGRDAYVGPNASVIHALVGDRVVIHAGVAIGQDGFGFAMGPDGHLKVPQIGRVIIQDDVEIGAGSAVDRGALSDTVIGEGTKIDNLVQIGHNVRIGRHCVLAGQVGISGSTVLEDFVVIGGQCGCAGHIRIGAGAQIAAMSGVTHSVPPGERWGGAPAKPVAQWSREIAVIKALGETLKGKALARLKQLLS